MPARYGDKTRELGDHGTIHTWGDGSRNSVASSFGSTAPAGNTRDDLNLGLDHLKLEVTSGGEPFACDTYVGGGHS